MNSMRKEVKLENEAFVRRAAADGMVLLKNENDTLPLKPQDTVALFGRTQITTYKGGFGSGDVHAARVVPIVDGLRAAGVRLYAPLAQVYTDWHDAQGIDMADFNREWSEFVHALPEMPVTRGMAADAAAHADIAIVVLGRTLGESQDVQLEAGDYYLSETEREMLEYVCEAFSRVAVVLNISNMTDLSYLDACGAGALLYMSQGGQQGGPALADILTGKVSPSGKLTATWARRYEDYPTGEDFYEKTVPYKEGIYVGYRYFDTFGVEPAYPFGYGLSYTTFEIKVGAAVLQDTTVRVEAAVKNTGATAGKEVVQCYLSAPDGELEKAYQELAAFEKTGLLQPGESQTVRLEFDIRDFASYEERRSAYILEAGRYAVRVGNSSRSTQVACVVELDETAVCRKVKNRLPLRQALQELKKAGASPYTYEGEQAQLEAAAVLPLEAERIQTAVLPVIEDTPAEVLLAQAGGHVTLADVVAGEATYEQLVAQMSDAELALLLNGVVGGTTVNANVGSMSRHVRGAAGDTWSNEAYKIPSCVMADGPSGIRLTTHRHRSENPDEDEYAKYCTAYPTGTCMANTWDLALSQEMGERIGIDMDCYGIDGWLAPGINIHRNPLCGRNFEYFSEDPLLTGKLAAAQTMGMQTLPDGSPSHRFATIKHLVCNEQEVHRSEGDSVVGERALREIYLRAFEIAIRESAPLAVMTSYNKVNGQWASASWDLLMGIVRGEWGYEGLFMTDWSVSAPPEEIPASGNDLNMPGNCVGFVQKAIENGKLPRAMAQHCAIQVLRLVAQTAVRRMAKAIGDESL